jgi:hypothetical protein
MNESESESRVGLLKIEESELEVLNIEEPESEFFCTDSTALASRFPAQTAPYRLRTSTNILRYWNGTYLYRKGIEAE